MPCVRYLYESKYVLITVRVYRPAGLAITGASGIANAPGASALDPSSAASTPLLLAEGGLFGTGLSLNPIELLTALTEAAITGLHDLLQGMGVPSAYGISIIFFTIFVKTLTYPLTYQQLASTTKMQTLGPKVCGVFSSITVVVAVLDQCSSCSL